MKIKNAKRKHYLAPVDPTDQTKVPETDAWLWIAAGIKESAPENDEETDDSGYFDGDGTPDEIVTSKKRGRSFEGHRHYGDAAQDYVAGKEDETGDDLLVWYKEVTADGKIQKMGLARLSEIEIGDGEATELETISFKVVWITKPIRSEVVTD